MFVDYVTKKNQYDYTTNISITPYGEMTHDLSQDFETLLNCQFSQYLKINIVSFDNDVLIDHFGIIDVPNGEVLLCPINRTFHRKDITNDDIFKCDVFISPSIAYSILTMTELVVFPYNTKINGYDFCDILFTYINSASPIYTDIITLKQIRALPNANFIFKNPNIFEFKGHIDGQINSLRIMSFVIRLLNIALYTVITDFAYVDNSNNYKRLECLIRYDLPINKAKEEKKLITSLDQLASDIRDKLRIKYGLIIIQKNYFGEIMIKIYEQDDLVFAQYLDMLILLCFPQYYEKVATKLT